MSAVPHDARPRLVASALASVESFFLQPAVGEPAPVEPAPLRTHRQVVVAALGARGGATTLARALALELAARCGGGAIVGSHALPARATPPGRQARRLCVAFGGAGEEVRPSGRLCLVVRPLPATAAASRYLAPFVADWRFGNPVAEAAALGAAVVLVATPAIDPALAAAASATVAGPVVVALNRARPLDEWGGTADVAVPEARLAARLACAGRPVTGSFAAAITQLADLVGR